MKRKNTSVITSLLILAVMVFFLSRLGTFNPNQEGVSLNEVIKTIEENKAQKVEITGSDIEVAVKDSDKILKSTIGEELKSDFYNNYIKDKLENNELEYYSKPEPQSPWYLQMLPSLLMIFVMGFFVYVFITKMQGGNSNVQNFSKSKAILNENKDNKISFKDVAGLKEEKEELTELVDFLKNPQKFVKMGARIPKGVLMVGPPGTGKTYLSRAVAGEAKVPFYSISGSDFVEMFVGVGASRVRNMFQEAKKNAPCIIFIDEIDAVGRQRGTGLGGGHDEREQTLNQLLVEMDGFSDNEGIIVMAATNRPDILDKALLRPGRFDRTVYVGLPDVKERQEVLKIHTKNKPLEKDVNLEKIAKETTGFSPADLENLTNEAALLAARRSSEFITKSDIEEATIKVIAGPEKKSKHVIEKERILTAYHEAGHAITQSLIDGMDPVNMITIVPRGQAGGFTSFLPEEDRSFMTRNEMKNEIITLLGGRAAEAVVLDDISTGASNDIERATKIAKDMVTTYGMSDLLGPIFYSDENTKPFVGRDIGHSKGFSEKTAVEIDEEVRDIIKKSYKKSIQILKDNIDLLHDLAKTLLEKETIKFDEFNDFIKKYTDKDLEKELNEEGEKLNV
ncbi:MAG: ATP-dependent zinc metalloprotease FtsH [Tissierellia bacterium]|nr:ATP-dependent zinc metalloprotease FtsH [Tissierellia bacterium]